MNERNTRTHCNTSELCRLSVNRSRPAHFCLPKPRKAHSDWQHASLFFFSFSATVLPPPPLLLLPSWEFLKLSSLDSSLVCIGRTLQG